MARPVIFVLAGVNGAGKSSVLGATLKAKGLDWFNPDQFSRLLMERSMHSKAAADAEAWNYGKSRLDQAIARKTSFAFETTLGGNTMAQAIQRAARTHDVHMIYCGLDTVERHIARVKLRTQHGGHDIPEERIRQRFKAAPLNLVALMPRLAWLQVFDNSEDAAPGAPVPDPILVLEIKDGVVLHPKASDQQALTRIPAWAKPLVEAALRMSAKPPEPSPPKPKTRRHR